MRYSPVTNNTCQGSRFANLSTLRLIATDSQGNVNSLLRFPATHATQEASIIRDVDAFKLSDASAKDESEASSSAQPSQVAAADRTTDADAKNLGFANGYAKREKRRRLSLPPLEEPAKTAAEVADSASLLDEDGLETEDSAQSSVNFLPLFSHECLSSTDEDQPANNEMLDAQQQSYNCSPVNLDQSEVDFDDPLIEHFPSDRDSIIATVRRLSTSVELDPTTVDVPPLSPVFKPCAEDAGPSGESGSLSTDDAASHGRYGRHSVTHGTSRTSLGSIAENEEATRKDMTGPAAEELDTTVHQIGRHKPSLASSNSNEDEGIAMGVTLPGDISKGTPNDPVNYTVQPGADETATGESTPRTVEHGIIASGSSDPVDPTVLRKPVNSERPRSPSSTYSLHKPKH